MSERKPPCFSTEPAFHFIFMGFSGKNGFDYQIELVRFFTQLGEFTQFNTLIIDF